MPDRIRHLLPLSLLLPSCLSAGVRNRQQGFAVTPQKNLRRKPQKKNLSRKSSKEKASKEKASKEKPQKNNHKKPQKKRPHKKS